jgi:hypothetical protein
MKQSDLAKKHGITPQRVGQLRKKHCNSEDFCEETRTLTPLGVKKIEEQLGIVDNEILEPKFVRVQVIEATSNPLFFYCKLLEKPYKKVCVSVPYTHTQSTRPQLIFKAQVIQKNNEKFYRHEIIYKRELQRIQRLKKASI